MNAQREAEDAVKVDTFKSGTAFTLKTNKILRDSAKGKVSVRNIKKVRMKMKNQDKENYCDNQDESEADNNNKDGSEEDIRI